MTLRVPSLVHTHITLGSVSCLTPKQYSLTNGDFRFVIEYRVALSDHRKAFQPRVS